MCTRGNGPRRNAWGRRIPFCSTMAINAIPLLFMACVIDALPVNETLKLPSYINPCRQNDPELNSCVREAINTFISNIKLGSQDMGFPSLDPLVVPLVDLSVDSGNLTLQMFLKDVSVRGIEQTKAISVKASLADFKMEVASKTPFFQAEGMFSADGHVLSFPLHASGTFSVNLTDVTAVWIVYYHEEPPTSGGATHFKIDEFGIDVIPSDVRFDFGPQMDGDNELGAAMNTFLNGNSHEIFNDVKPRATEILGRILTDICNSVFDNYPSHVLFPEE